MNLLKPLGFVPAGVILFWSVAFAFGSRRYGRDLLVGLLLVLFAYLGFTYGLGLQLPPGILKGLF
jgi:putative tricarboxylic transport membrane protein